MFADVARAVGRYCDHEGLTRPSYEQIRVLYHEAREVRERRRAAFDVVADVHLNARPVRDLLFLLEDPRRAPRRQ